MNPEARKVRSEVGRLERNLVNTKENLKRIVDACDHKYGEVAYDPIYTPEYTIPGDPPGTMGVDWRGPCHVSAETKKRWRRECTLCGEVEYTDKILKKVKEEPDFGDGRKK